MPHTPQAPQPRRRGKAGLSHRRAVRSDSSHSLWTRGLTRDFRAPAQGSPAVGLRVGPRGTVTAAHKDPELPLESGRRPRVTKGHTGTGAPPGAPAVSPLSPANALLTPPRLPVAPSRGLGPLGLRSPSGDREGGCWPSRPGGDGEVERPVCLRPQAPRPRPRPGSGVRATALHTTVLIGARDGDGSNSCVWLCHPRPKPGSSRPPTTQA